MINHQQLSSGMTQSAGLLRGLQIHRGFLFHPQRVRVRVCSVCSACARTCTLFFVAGVFCHSIKPAEIAQSCARRQNDSSGVPNRFSQDSVGVTAADALFVHFSAPRPLLFTPPATTCTSSSSSPPSAGLAWPLCDRRVCVCVLFGVCAAVLRSKRPARQTVIILF